MRSALLAILIVVLVLYCLGVDAAAKRRKKKEKKTKPTEVTDLMSDIGGTMCRKLAKHVKRKKFMPGRRCDLFIEQIEELSSMTDAMVNEMDMTQQDFVDIAMKPGNLMQLGMNMKQMAKFVLQKKAPSEKEIQQEMSKTMGQWILNVGTNQVGNQNGLDKLPREALKGLRAMGINVPTYGAQDDDEMDEENALMPDDYAWAASNSDGDADEADDEDGEL